MSVSVASLGVMNVFALPTIERPPQACYMTTIHNVSTVEAAQKYFENVAGQSSRLWATPVSATDNAAVRGNQRFRTL
jgi:hypothetical protein